MRQALAATAVVTLSALSLSFATASPASADGPTLVIGAEGIEPTPVDSRGTTLVIGAEGLETTYLGVYEVVASDGNKYLAYAWAPPVGGGRSYCWVDAPRQCWWEQFPAFGNPVPWLS